jgi:hypothetical protein
LPFWPEERGGEFQQPWVVGHFIECFSFFSFFFVILIV